MHEDDRRIMLRCGYGFAEAAEIMKKAAESHKRSREAIADMYAEREDQAFKANTSRYMID